MMTLRRTLSRTAFLTGCYVLFFVLTPPANAMAWFLAAGSAHRFTLQHASGSFWHGQADAVLVNRADGPVRYAGVHWHLAAGALAKKQIALDFSGHDLHMQLIIDQEGVHVEDTGGGR